MQDHRNGLSSDRELVALTVELRHLKETLSDYKFWIGRQIESLRLDLRAEANARENLAKAIRTELQQESAERKAIAAAINRGIAALALTACGVIFELLRKGVIF